MGCIEEPAGQSTGSVVVSHFPDGGLTGSIVPARDFAWENLVSWPAQN